MRVPSSNVEECEKKIRKSIEGLTPEKAIADLEERIFIEEMADFMDFGFVEACEKIIDDLKSTKQ